MNDQHICPVCHSQQREIMDTWCCPLCDFDTIKELEVAQMWKEITDMESELSDDGD